MNINQPYPNLDVNGNPILSTTTVTNHGLFYTTHAIPDGKTFYCPGVTSDMSERLTYENYLTTSGQWPAYSRIDNAFVRLSYSYYPQTELIRADRPPTVVPFGGYTVAKKITELSPKHSILTDLAVEDDNAESLITIMDIANRVREFVGKNFGHAESGRRKFASVNPPSSHCRLQH